METPGYTGQAPYKPSPKLKDWNIKIPMVLMAARATPHQSTGVPPFTLITGRNMTLPLHLWYQPGDLNLVTAYNTYQYLEELHQHLRTTFTFAQQQLQRSAEGRKAFYDRKASHHEPNVGDKVWYYSFARPRQNAPHRLSKKFLLCSPLLIQHPVHAFRGEQRK